MRWPALLAPLALVVAFLVGAANAPSSARQEGGFLGASAAGPSPAEALPNGFHDAVAFSGLTNPTAIRFAPDGRIFVAEKSGLVKVFDSLSDQTPAVVLDLSTEVDDYWDRGLLGMALDPAFPASPYLYLLYTYDAPPGRTAPVWEDDCPTPPGPTTDGCVVTGKLVRVHLSGGTVDQPPQTLLAGQWCQQYPSHSVGDLRFGPDGDLYVSGGDGASFEFADYGQGGGGAGSPTPRNPCGDPPAGVGGAETPPSALGGALRSQSSRRPAGPVLLNGAVLRLNPATGAAAAGNPNAGSADPNLRRIIAYGLRNPFRISFRPGTSELWIGDVGWNSWEEINRRSSPTGPVQNFGWPCYEGSGPMQSYQDAGLSLCNALYAAGTATGPYYSYSHGDEVVPGDGCPTANGSVVSALTFYPGGDYPASYGGALVFADYSRNCIWTMGLGVGGDPDPSNLQLLESGAANPVDVEPGPGGDLYYVDFDGGTIHRISYAPTSSCSASDFQAEYFNNTALSGAPALTGCESAIDHSWGTGSPGQGVNPDNFSARWTAGMNFAPGGYTFTATADDGIRVYVDGNLLIDHWEDETSPATFTATTTLSAGVHEVRVEYYKATGDATVQVSWHLDQPDAPPEPVIDEPSPTLSYAVGQAIDFLGEATDPEDGALPQSALSWTLLIHHCTTPTTCHVHVVQHWTGTDGETLNAPDHDYPSHLELVLRATDSLGATQTTSVTLDPRTVGLALQTVPAGLRLSIGGASGTAPFSRTEIVNSQTSLSAPVAQQLNGKTYHFVSWSDAGAATHNITAPATPRTYTATYALQPTSTGRPVVTGVARQGKRLTTTPGTWAGSPVAFAYAWLRCNRNGAGCAVIGGAGGASYTLTGFDVGSRIVVEVTATNAVGSSFAMSIPTAVVTRAVRGTIRAFPRRHVRLRPRRHR